MPEAKLTDRAQAVASVSRILREHPEIETVLVGDGWPIFHDGQRARGTLRSLSAARGGRSGTDGRSKPDFDFRTVYFTREPGP